MKPCLIILSLLCGLLFAGMGLTGKAEAIYIVPVYNIDIAQPNGSTVWAAETTNSITVTTTNSKPTGWVKLYYRTGTKDFWTYIGCVDMSYSLIGNYSWTVPPVHTDNAQIKAEWVGDCGSSNVLASDVSDTFSITTPTIAVTSPSAGETVIAGSGYTITYTTSPAPAGGKVRFSYRLNPSDGWRSIGCGDKTGSYAWTVPYEIDGTPVNTGRAQILAHWAPACEGDSYNFVISPEFTIAPEPRSIQITLPQHDAYWLPGSWQVIAWEASGASGSSPGEVQVLFSTGSDTEQGTIWADRDGVPYLWRELACRQNPAAGELLWQVPSGFGWKPAWIKVEWWDSCSGRSHLYAGDEETVIITARPKPPSNLMAATLLGTGIKLSWTDNAWNEEGFKVERKRHFGGGDYEEIAEVGANTAEYTDTSGLWPSSQYRYRVCAFNSYGESLYSNEAEATYGYTIGENVFVRFSIDKLTFYVDNAPRTMDAAPLIREGRTLLPVRYVAEALGAAVDWDPAQKKATVKSGNKTIELWVGKSTAMVNGAVKSIDAENAKVTPVVVPPGRTMLPLRFIMENLGCKVDWDATSQEVMIMGPAAAPGGTGD
ncbi:MAG: stalk domain-containing protein [Bacillota bacterium]